MLVWAGSSKGIVLLASDMVLAGTQYRGVARIFEKMKPTPKAWDSCLLRHEWGRARAWVTPSHQGRKF